MRLCRALATTTVLLPCLLSTVGRAQMSDKYQPNAE